jgi:DNA polymerase-3 subunit alpha
VEMLPPDINLSGREFTVIGNSIRFGLEAVKGVGAAAIESIIDVRTEGGAFLSVSDFIERVDTRKANKKVLESLVKAGAFDSLGVSRAAAMKTVSDVLNGGRVKNPGQPSIFGDELPEDAEAVEEWEEADVLKNEKEALGFYITGHPLTKYEKMLGRLGAGKTSGLENAADKEEVVVGGIIRVLKKKNVKSTGDMMAYVTLEDDEGSVEVIVFPDLYRKTNGLLTKDETVLVKGNIDKDEKGVRVRAREVSRLEEAGRQSIRKMELSIEDPAACSGKLPEIREAVDRFPGEVQFYLKIRLNGTQTIIATGCRIRPDRELVSTLEDVVGKGAVTVS